MCALIGTYIYSTGEELTQGAKVSSRCLSGLVHLVVVQHDLGYPHRRYIAPEHVALVQLRLGVACYVSKLPSNETHAHD